MTVDQDMKSDIYSTFNPLKYIRLGKCVTMAVKEGVQCRRHVSLLKIKARAFFHIALKYWEGGGRGGGECTL